MYVIVYVLPNAISQPKHFCISKRLRKIFRISKVYNYLSDTTRVPASVRLTMSHLLFLLLLHCNLLLQSGHHPLVSLRPHYLVWLLAGGQVGSLGRGEGGGGRGGEGRGGGREERVTQNNSTYAQVFRVYYTQKKSIFLSVPTFSSFLLYSKEKHF